MQLSRFLRNALLLIAILFVVDRGIGYLLDELFYKQTHGDDANTAYALQHAKEDILVFGSSRASHHYISSRIEQATGYTCYNAGRDEMTILYLDAMLPVIYARYTPKIILLEIAPTELAKRPENDVAIQRVSTVLLPFAHRYPILLPIISLPGPTESFKFKASRIYAYNSLIGSMVQNTYTHIGHISQKGYEPLVGSIDSSSYIKSIWKDFDKNFPLDSTMTNSLHRIINITKAHGTQLMIIISPFYFPFNMDGNDSYENIIRVANVNNIPFYDFSHDRRFLKHPSLFKDDVHLNDSGARIYTQIITGILTTGK